MGYSRPQPRHLASKLRKARIKLGVTQQELAERLTTKRSPVYPGHVSEFERGKREPSLIVLLRYARQSRVSVDDLIDDDIEFPKASPGN